MTLGALLTVFSTELKIFYLAFLMLTELFNMCLKEFYFPDYYKVSPVVSVFKRFRESSIAKTTTLLIFSLWFIISLKTL